MDYPLSNYKYRSQCQLEPNTLAGPADTSLLYKISSLAAALGVTEFLTFPCYEFVTLKSDLEMGQTGKCKDEDENEV